MPKIQYPVLVEFGGGKLGLDVCGEGLGLAVCGEGLGLAVRGGV